MDKAEIHGRGAGYDRFLMDSVEGRIYENTDALQLAARNAASTYSRDTNKQDTFAYGFISEYIENKRQLRKQITTAPLAGKYYCRSHAPSWTVVNEVERPSAHMCDGFSSKTHERCKAYADFVVTKELTLH